MLDFWALIKRVFFLNIQYLSAKRKIEKLVEIFESNNIFTSELIDLVSGSFLSANKFNLRLEHYPNFLRVRILQ